MKNSAVVKFLLSVALTILVTIYQPLEAFAFPELSRTAYDDKKGLTLEGDWLFFPNEFYSTNEVVGNWNHGKLVQVPSKYLDSLRFTEGYGTFAIKVQLPSELVGEIQAIRVPYQHGAMDIYIDDLNVVSAGSVAANKEEYSKMDKGPFSYFMVTDDTFYVVVHFASHGILKSGFSAPIQIGDPEQLMKYKQGDFYGIVFLLGILILVGLFAIFIGLIDKKHRSLLIFGLFSLTVMLRCVITAPFLYTEIVLPFPISQILAIRLEYILSLLIGYFFMYYVVMLYKNLFNKYVVYVNKIIYAITAIVLLFIPATFLQYSFTLFVAVQASLVTYLVKILIQAYRLKLKFALMNIVSVLLLASSLIFELLSAYNIVPAGPYVLVVLTLISVVLTYEFAKFYVHQIRKLNDLNQQLFVMNNSLDELVQQRTDELTMLNIKLQNQANVDALTGIYNRAYLNEKLDELFMRAKNHNNTLSLVILDIDEFKQYNDSNGHIKGDSILTQIVDITKELLPHNSILARYGGEEFVILFYNFHESEVINTCEAIRLKIEQENIVHEVGRRNKVTISLGGYYMNTDSSLTRSIDLLDKADRQLYVAKRTGKNRTSFEVESD